MEEGGSGPWMVIVLMYWTSAGERDLKFGQLTMAGI
jgi:hypothetical protein